MSKRKIVFVGAAGSVSLTGGFRVIAGYADRLQSRGYDVAIVAPGGAPRKPRTLFERIRRRLRRLLKPATKPAVVERPFLKNPDVRIDIAPGKNALSSEDMPQADVLIATWWETAEWVSAAPRGVAKLHLVQGYEVFPYLSKERVHAAYRLPIEKVVVSRWPQGRLKDACGVDHATLIENAIDMEGAPAAPRRKGGAPTIGFVFSLAATKNSALALAVCRALKKQRPDLRVIAFGSHTPRREHDMPNWVEFAHGPPEDELKALYRSCDAWLFTSD